MLLICFITVLGADSSGGRCSYSNTMKLETLLYVVYRYLFDIFNQCCISLT